ncbi:MAG: hypothetical protein OXJ52_03540 [Oligoflexia bacterium]|nr:hypothetical protein [Oligoflexia bacterium]
MKKIFKKRTLTTRRKFIFFVAFLPLFSKTKLIQWQSILYLPKPMNWSVFYDYQKKIMNLSSIHELELEMIKKKSMLVKKTQLIQNKAIFTFIFKTTEDYQYWIKKSSLCLNSKYFNKADYHCGIKTIFV